MKEEILKFMSNRPDAIGIIGYGSGVNPQKGQEKRNPQIDLIVIVDNLKSWHKQNILVNKNDYSFTARLFFRYGAYSWIKAGAHICYMTYIHFNGREYKIGTIEKKDFLNDLNNWETFYMAGRMQKPILVVKSDDEIEKAIDANRLSGVLTTKLLMGDGEKRAVDFYMTLASLSYIGDTRMGIAENPDKVRNIVEGRYDFYEEHYGKILGVSDEIIRVANDYDVQILPRELRNYLNDVDVDLLSDRVSEFLRFKNRGQSFAQTIKGIFTTGPAKAIKYALEKLKRKRKK